MKLKKILSLRLKIGEILQHNKIPQQFVISTQYHVLYNYAKVEFNAILFYMLHVHVKHA